MFTRPSIWPRFSVCACHRGRGGGARLRLSHATPALVVRLPRSVNYQHAWYGSRWLGAAISLLWIALYPSARTRGFGSSAIVAQNV